MTTRNEPPDADAPQPVDPAAPPEQTPPADQNPPYNATAVYRTVNPGQRPPYNAQPIPPQQPPPSYYYNAPPPQQPYQYGYPGYVLPEAHRASPLPWIMGGVAALALVAFLFVFFSRFSQPVVTVDPTASPTQAQPTNPPLAMDTAGPTSTPWIIVVTATPPSAATIAIATEQSAPTTIAALPTIGGSLPLTTITVTATAALTGTQAISATQIALATLYPSLPTVTPIPGATNTPTPATPSPTVVVVTATPTATPTPDLPPAVGASGYADAGPVAASPGSLTLQYFGQSTFYIVSGSDVRMLLNPASPQSGYRLPFFNGLNALMVSNWGADNTFTQVAPGSATNFRGLKPDGSFNPVNQDNKTFAVRDVASYHDNSNGSQFGANAMWVIDIDGFHIVHLGDLGQTELTDQQISDLGQPDILMIPVGGGDVIDANGALNIIRQLNPRLVVPMRYRTDRTSASSGLDDLSNFVGSVDVSNQPNSLRLRKSDLPTDGPRLLVMDYAEH